MEISTTEMHLGVSASIISFYEYGKAKERTRFSERQVRLYGLNVMGGDTK